MTGRRIVSIWLPQFPMERWLKAQERLGNAPSDDLPLALVTEGPHGPVVHAVNRAAHAAGVTVGARAVDMRALCPALKVEFADPQGDRAALGRLALWAQRWCPWVAADDWAAQGAAGGGCGLILDTTGAAHLLGGEAAMLQEIEAALALLGFSARLALAPTWGAAWALARFGPVRAIWRGADDLAPLPVAALRLDGETVLLLNRLGLRTVGLLQALPRLSLARRFLQAAAAQNPLIRLDQMTGHLPEPVSPAGTPPVFRADMRLAEPILDPTHHLPALCAALCGQLAAAHQGARRLRLTVYRTDGEVSRIEAACAAPSRDAAHLAFLFRDRLEKINPGFGFDLISLEAPVTEMLGTRQADLAGGTDVTLELSHLVDRLAARFGRAALVQLQPAESHIPERAELRVAPLRAGGDEGGQVAALARRPPPPSPPHAGEGRRPGSAAGPQGPTPATASTAFGAQPHGEADRPQRLLDPAEELRVLYAVPEGPPAQFLWRRLTHRVTRYQGPERIAPEWWHDRPGTRLRDYFKVEDEAGRRFWLYREGLADDGRGGAPRWFLHGIFA